MGRDTRGRTQRARDAGPRTLRDKSPLAQDSRADALRAHALADPFDRGVEAARSGNKAAAIVLFRQCLAIRPDHAQAHQNLAGALRDQGDLAGAVDGYRAAVALRPGHAEARINLAETLRRLGSAREALACCDEALAIGGAAMEAHVVRGLIRKDLGDAQGAIDDMRRATSIDPKAAAVHKILGRLLFDSQRRTEAMESFQTACRLNPDDPESHRFLGDLYDLEGLAWQSFECYRRAVELSPRDAVAYSNLAGMLCHTNQLDLSIAAARVSIQLSPAVADAYFNLATALELQGKTAEAMEAYADALARKPDLGDALVAICRLREHSCDWDGLAASEGLAQTMTYKKGKSVVPFAMLPMTSSPAALLHCARTWAASMRRGCGEPLSRYLPRAPERRGDRLRIGYLSADFHVHATAALIAEVFELHDKDRFETFGYSIGNDDRSAMRQRLVGALDHFVDASKDSHSATAARIHADAIDILVDLKGYTFQARPQILARRPAPIQVNFLGYPGTMGASFIDYVIADRIVAPMEHQRFFDEKIVHLPDSYQPNDRKRVIAARTPTRAECGLPEDGFIFCSFNANYKLSPPVFDRWMRILPAVPGSVLWLLQSDASAPTNLRREAARRGVDPARLIFAPKLPVEDHLARMRLGDLFLDTLPVGAHTTASEALWAGLPVLTCLGEAFAARVGASLLDAVGLPELIATSLDAYETLAIQLGRDATAMQAIKRKLASNRLVAPLFDAPRYTRNLEAAFARMAAMRDAGQQPEPFAVDGSTSL